MRLLNLILAVCLLGLLSAQVEAGCHHRGFFHRHHQSCGCQSSAAPAAGCGVCQQGCQQNGACAANCPAGGCPQGACPCPQAKPARIVQNGKVYLLDQSGNYFLCPNCR